MTHTGAPAGVGDVIRKLGEALGAAGNDDLGLAGLNLHDPIGNGLQAAAALASNGIGTGLIRQAGLETDGASDKAVRAPGADLTDDTLVHNRRVDPGALHRLTHHESAHVYG